MAKLHAGFALCSSEWQFDVIHAAHLEIAVVAKSRNLADTEAV